MRFFQNNVFVRCYGNIVTTGTAIAEILPPISRFSPDGKRTKKREKVLSRLIDFFNSFFDVTDFN